MNHARYRFRIEELASEPETFIVLYPYEKTAHDIVLEAARLFYYGKKGWAEGWPLTFVIETIQGATIIRSHVFVVSPTPDFDVVLCDPPLEAPPRGHWSPGVCVTRHQEKRLRSPPGIDSERV